MKSVLSYSRATRNFHFLLTKMNLKIFFGPVSTLTKKILKIFLGLREYPKHGARGNPNFIIETSFFLVAFKVSSEILIRGPRSLNFRISISPRILIGRSARNLKTSDVSGKLIISGSKYRRIDSATEWIGAIPSTRRRSQTVKSIFEGRTPANNVTNHWTEKNDRST